MNKLIIIVIVIVLGFAVFLLIGVPSSNNGVAPLEPNTPSKIMSLQLSSPAFADSASIPEKYTCDEADVNPPLIIEGVPEGTQSLVLIVHDPDAPAGDWVHWVLANIPPETTIIDEDAVPEGTIQGMTSFGESNYGGPCPPSGTHRYQFRLYALDTIFKLTSETTREDLESLMEGHIIDETLLTGVYERVR